MYNLPYFKEPDQSEIEKFMLANSFALICGSDSSGFPVATQVPLLIRKTGDKFFFRGHIMRNTDHHKAFLENAKVLTVFSGAHTYVSASWYTNPLQGSTWNYLTVQAKGHISFQGEDELRETLRETTSLFENDSSSPSLFDKLPVDYVERLVKAIVGFEIDVTEINHVFKLSQNRDPESYLNIIRRLEEGDANSRAIAAEMKRRYSRLYQKPETEKAIEKD